MKTTHSISIFEALLWVFGYFSVMLLYTGIDMGVWRNMDVPYASWFHLITIAVLSTAFIWLMTKKTSLKLNFFDYITATGVITALLCSILFYFLLDKCLDPYLERLFPASEEIYQDTILTLSKTPIVSFLHVCILSPIIEELLMRRFVLGGLSYRIGMIGALLLSAFLFALLHFNMVQTLSAFLCGLILGGLYIKTKSIFCCILAHSFYNTISYIVMILR